jgi:hypothetical protein
MNIMQLLNGDFSQWRGLSPGTTAQALLEQLLPCRAVAEPEARERGAYRFWLRVVHRSEPPRQVEVWSRHGSGAAAFLAWDEPPCADVAALFESYGPPEGKLESSLNAEGAVVRQWVYAARGIAFAVAEPYPGSHLSGPRLLQVQVFPPTTVTAYLTQIGTGNALRPYPCPRQASGVNHE